MSLSETKKEQHNISYVVETNTSGSNLHKYKQNLLAFILAQVIHNVNREWYFRKSFQKVR